MCSFPGSPCAHGGPSVFLFTTCMGGGGGGGGGGSLGTRLVLTITCEFKRDRWTNNYMYNNCIDLNMYQVHKHPKKD